jgi:excisionase family DNA binding protein
MAGLVRPSQLARFWELHPKTVIDWIHAGRLPAVRTPGAQWRVRPSDLPAFCAREALAMPPFASGRTRVHVVGGAPAAVRALKRALAHADASIEAPEDPFDALFTAVRQGAAGVVAIDASSSAFDACAAIRALLRVNRALRVVAFDAASPARARALTAAGAARVLLRRKEPTLAAVITEMI